jgi:uncharacterized membrane protein YebE (DUF533 family)
MFDAVKLLGKIVRAVTGSDYGKHSKKKKKYKKSKNPLVSNLKSGAGLMTAIGLGIGAYEILKNKQQSPAAPTGQPYVPPIQGHVSPSSGQQMAPPPPPPPPSQPVAQPGTVAAAPAVPATPIPSTQVDISNISVQDLAKRMIQTMIASAHADGTLDEEEEKAILERLKAAELSQEERMFLLTELHNPKTIEELTDGITDPAAAKAMYLIAVSTIEIDTEAERQWLEQLGGRLGLSKAVQEFIQEQE